MMKVDLGNILISHLHQQFLRFRERVLSDAERVEQLRNNYISITGKEQGRKRYS